MVWYFCPECKEKITNKKHTGHWADCSIGARFHQIYCIEMTLRNTTLTTEQRRAQVTHRKAIWASIPILGYESDWTELP